jgi:uncharacterized membrane protein YfcA
MKRKKDMLALLFGAAAGFINGLLGAGGGILLVRGAKYLFPDSVSQPRDVFASALAVMLPISAASVVLYSTQGGAIPLEMPRFALPAVLGGTGGAMLLSVIEPRLLKLIFAALTVWSGIMMLR